MSALLLLFLEKFKFRPQTCKKYASKQKWFRISFCTKMSVTAYIYSQPPHRWSYEARKIDVVEWLKYFYQTQKGTSNNTYKTENKTRNEKEKQKN